MPRLAVPAAAEKPNPHPVVRITFRGQVVFEHGVQLPGYQEACRAVTTAMLRPQLEVPNQAAD